MRRIIKKRYILIPVLVVVLGLMAYYFWSLSELHLTKRIFGVNEDDYEMISRENTLSMFQYGGTYTIVLRVCGDEMEAFLQKIESEGYTQGLEDKSLRGYYAGRFKNTTGVEKSDKDYAYIVRTVVTKYICNI